MLFIASCRDKHDRAFDAVADEPTATYTPAKQTITTAEEISNDKADDLIIEEENGVKRLRINNIGRLRDVFNDSNNSQLRHALRLGIEPITDIRKAYHTSRPVIKISSTDLYAVDSLKHSLPFLVPEAARLLNIVGRNFRDSLTSRGAEGYRIRVTSLLRTPHTVKRLRRVNINATDSSTHQFGTTFDISYTRFDHYGNGAPVAAEDLKNLLAEVLNDLRTRGYCLVKFERATSCFHITATQ